METDIPPDVCFLVGDRRESIYAHRATLACQSSVFQAMFYGSLPESSKIVIPDISPDVFKVMLRFLYYKKTELSGENIVHVLLASKKYLIQSLIGACREYLLSNIDTGNACTVVEVALELDEEVVLKPSLDFVDRNTKECLHSDSFLDLNPSNLCVIIKRDTLKINEDELFTCVMNWAKYACEKFGLTQSGFDKRHVLGRSLYLIRFALIKVSVLWEYLMSEENEGLLNTEELQCLRGDHSGCRQRAKFGECFFSSRPRDTFGDVIKCTRFTTYSARKNIDFNRSEIKNDTEAPSQHTLFSLSFKCSRPILLTGLGLYTGLSNISKCGMEVRVENEDAGEMTAQEHQTAFVLLFHGTNEILLNTGVYIDAGIWHTVYVKLSGQVLVEGQSDLCSCVLSKAGNTSFEFNYDAHKNNIHGQIPYLLFKEQNSNE